MTFVIILIGAVVRTFTKSQHGRIAAAGRAVEWRAEVSRRDARFDGRAKLYRPRRNPGRSEIRT